MALSLAALEGLLKVARRDHPEIDWKMRQHGVLLQNALRKDPSGASSHEYTARHKGHKWYCIVRITPDGVLRSAAFWWLHGSSPQEQALDALVLRHPRQPLHFDSHFFSRWGLRSERMGVLLTNMMGFFKQYPVLPLKKVHRFYDAQPEYAAAIDQGLVFARPNGSKLISCDTFKSHEMLNDNERRLWSIIRKQVAAPSMPS